MIRQAYSLWQYRLYLTVLAIFFFIKFSLVILGRGEGSPPSIGERFAAASALFLAIHLFSAYALFWSLLLLECAWIYVFFPQEPGAAALIELAFISGLLFCPALASLELKTLSKYTPFQKRQKGQKGQKGQAQKKSAFRLSELHKDWQMSAWLLYSSQFLFLLSLGIWFFYGEIEEIAEIGGELFLMQSIFFIFVFNPRWLKAREVKNEKSPIIFFDGLCVFCNSWVDFLLKEDYLHTFRFSPLQGKLARRLLPVKGLKDPQHLLLFIAKNEVYFGAEAVLWIASTLGGMWRILAWGGRLIPQSLRVKLYAFIAARRYRYFGKRKDCPIPSNEEREYFLE